MVSHIIYNYQSRSAAWAVDKHTKIHIRWATRTLLAGNRIFYHFTHKLLSCAVKKHSHDARIETAAALLMIELWKENWALNKIPYLSRE